MHRNISSPPSDEFDRTIRVQSSVADSTTWTQDYGRQREADTKCQTPYQNGPERCRGVPDQPKPATASGGATLFRVLDPIGRFRRGVATPTRRRAAPRRGGCGKPAANPPTARQAQHVENRLGRRASQDSHRLSNGCTQGVPANIPRGGLRALPCLPVSMQTAT